MKLLNEALENRPRILQDIELHFDLLKQDYKKNKDSVGEIEKKIKKFSRLKDVYFILKPGLNNAFVITEYNSIFERIIKTIIYPSEKNELKIKQYIDKEEQILPYIDKVYIVYGTKLLKECSSKENVAILLHELGHIFGHTSYIYKLASIVNNILRKK